MLPLEKEADIRRHYTNVLKQALYLQSGSSRAGMTLAKENQNRLWQALKASEYRHTNRFASASSTVGLLLRLFCFHICIRLFERSPVTRRSPSHQRGCVVFRGTAHVVV